MMGRQYPAAQLEDLHISYPTALVVLEKGHYLTFFPICPWSISSIRQSRFAFSVLLHRALPRY